MVIPKINSKSQAVAIDLGASSIRFAHGWFDGEKVGFEVVEQVPHEPKDHAGRLVWDLPLILSLCQRAEAYARALGPETTIGIDSWAVDHGFLDKDGNLLDEVVCYRDPSHVAVFHGFGSAATLPLDGGGQGGGDEHHDPESVKKIKKKLYKSTGVQHQPFNTIYQLIARREQHSGLINQAQRWLMLPELIAHLLGANAGHELTNASSTQLLGVDGTWSKEAFEIAGWPVPADQPQPPGTIQGKTRLGVPVARVGTHDTASAVYGLGQLADDQAFLSAGTWSLLGCLRDEVDTSDAAEAANFTNERAVDGRIRFLKNVPGFFVVNRLHEELKVDAPVSVWLSEANKKFDGRIDLLNERFFNPSSMVEAALDFAICKPESKKDWAALALYSLIDTTADQLRLMEKITGRTFKSLKVGGGGAASRELCQGLADRLQIPVISGPKEATLLGNLGAQFLAQGVLKSWDEVAKALEASTEFVIRNPRSDICLSEERATICRCRTLR
ncbi:MAG: hypothetical protein KF784_15205 [Fimbriimonadaceae bacterium]|nr:hypothetical protein [Fimbriimonadaceae bacterium]